MHLSCSVTNLPEGAVPEIHWIDANSRIIKSRFIVWHNLNAEHEGKYKCVVTVDGEETKEIIELKVHSKFQFFNSSNSVFVEYPKFLPMNHNLHFEIGSNARLQCLVSEPSKAGRSLVVIISK